MDTTQPEFWLKGPVPGVPSLLQPVAHALLQSRAEVKEVVKNFPEHHLWHKPAGVASVGFHLQHMAGVIDRLFTYARGEQLNEKQRTYLATEGQEVEGITVTGLIDQFSDRVARAVEQLQNTNEASLPDIRGVGRKQIPSNVLGLLFHAAEHTQRHTGQLLVTARILKAD